MATAGPEEKTVSPASCPVCGSSEKFKTYCPASFIAGDSRNIIECPACMTSVLWPLPSVHDFEKYYSGAYYNFDRHSEEGKGRFFAEILEKKKKKGRYLEIGCALGWFIYGVKSNCSWEVFGQETGRPAAEFARQKLGLNVTGEAFLDTGFPPDFFDLIRFNNVLEHMPDPADAFAEAARVLAPGGSLYISVPNGQIDRRNYLEYFRLNSRPAASRDGHVFFFNKKTLMFLAEKNGLKIAQKYSTGIKHGLMTAGYLPRKKGWEKAYERDVAAAAPKGPEPDYMQENMRRRPNGYYKFALYRDMLKRWPGLIDLACDFIIYYVKKEKK